MARMRGWMKDSASETEATPYRGVNEEDEDLDFDFDVEDGKWKIDPIWRLKEKGRKKKLRRCLCVVSVVIELLPFFS